LSSYDGRDWANMVKAAARGKSAGARATNNVGFLEDSLVLRIFVGDQRMCVEDGPAIRGRPPPGRDRHIFFGRLP